MQNASVFGQMSEFIEQNDILNSNNNFPTNEIL